MTKGFLYIATGEDYIKEAIISAKNTKRHSNLPIALVSHRPVDSELFDEVIIDENPHYSFADKCRNLNKTPFDKTIFLDTDVYLLESISELFEILEEIDIATTIDPNEWGGRIHRDAHFDEVPEAVPIFQTGVILYSNNERVMDFISTWTKIHIENMDNMLTDQSSFRIAIYKSNINHLALSNLYNCLVKWPMQVTGEVKVIHGGDLSISEIKRLSSRMNATDSVRLFYTPQNGRIYSPISPISNRVLRKVDIILTITSKYKRRLVTVVRSIRYKGFRTTFNNIYERYRN